MVNQDSLSLLLMMKIHSHLWTPIFTCIELWETSAKGGWTKVGRFLVPKCEVAILVRKCEVPNVMGSSGPTPLRGSIPRLLRRARGAPAGPGPTRAQSYQGVQAIAQLSPLQVRWT